jgi:hypothetical protein
MTSPNPECGCRIVGRGTALQYTHDEIVFCPLHAAAGELLVAVKDYLVDLKFANASATKEMLQKLIDRASGKRAG